jgi:hypothetical protein
MTSPYTRGPPLFHCPQLLIQKMCSCFPHLKTHSTISVYIKACKTHAVKVGTVWLKMCAVMWESTITICLQMHWSLQTILTIWKWSDWDCSTTPDILRRCLILILAMILAILPYFCGFPYFLCINAGTVLQLDMPTSISLPFH